MTWLSSLRGVQIFGGNLSINAKFLSSVCTDGRSYADVITKFSRMDRLRNFLSYGIPLARASRAGEAPLKNKIKKEDKKVYYPL